MDWISVDEELPQDLEEVMFLAAVENGKLREIMVGHLLKTVWFHCCFFYTSQSLLEDIKVTHWMRLPDYPSMESNNELD